MPIFIAVSELQKRYGDMNHAVLQKKNRATIARSPEKITLGKATSTTV
jgi:hypothetical protein